MKVSVIRGKKPERRFRGRREVRELRSLRKGMKDRWFYQWAVRANRGAICPNCDICNFMRKFLGALSSLYTTDAYLAIIKATQNSCVLYPEIFQVAGIWHCTCSQLSLITPCLFVFHMLHHLYSETVILELFLVFRLFLFATPFFFSFKTITTAITPTKPLNKRSSFTQGALEEMVWNWIWKEIYKTFDNGNIIFFLKHF